MSKRAAGLIAASVAIVLLAVAVGLRQTSEPELSAIGDIAAAIEAAGHRRAADRAREACKAARSSCNCRRETAKSALDADFHAQALAVLLSDPACRGERESGGIEAEALARAGRLEEGSAKAQNVLRETPLDPYATYAAAHVAYKQNDTSRAIENADRAAAQGRGVPAQLLLGLIAFRSGNLMAARNAFEAMLSIDPDSVDGIYNVGVVAQAQNRYREARESYLRALKLRPSHADARFNLVLLTSTAGAADEARHHASELEKVVGATDARAVRARSVVGASASAIPAPPAPDQ